MTHRDYLYGRLLAIADVAESETYDKTEARTTNARRYFNAFANRPYSTWRTIELKLDPYLSKLSLGRRKRYEILMQEVYDMFDREDFMDNSKLQPIFPACISLSGTRAVQKEANGYSRKRGGSINGNVISEN